MSSRVRIPIEGMTCTACVSRITGAIRKLDGVESVRVDLESESATVTFEPARVSLETIGGAIAKAGYEARLDLVEEVAPATTGERKGLLARFGLGR